MKFTKTSFYIVLIASTFVGIKETRSDTLESFGLKICRNYDLSKSERSDCNKNVTEYLNSNTIKNHFDVAKHICSTKYSVSYKRRIQLERESKCFKFAVTELTRDREQPMTLVSSSMIKSQTRGCFDQTVLFLQVKCYNDKLRGFSVSESIKKPRNQDETKSGSGR